MKKIMNTPENFVNEMLEGLYIAHGDLLTHTGDDLRCVVTANKVEGKVGLATGGGSGHLPLFLGYVGENMLDGCCVGDVFQSPSAEQMLAVTKEIDSGAGVVYIYGNYNGDIFNFDMAAEMADFEDNITVRSVVAGEDVASPAPAPGEKNTRRGVAGIFFVFKCAGAAAAEMMPLDEVVRVAQKAADQVRTMGVALSPCVVPKVGKAGFHIAEDEMEIGMGIHGETGIRRGKLQTADAIADEMLAQILNDLPYAAGDTVDVLVNGLGGTPYEEQYIVVRRIKQVLSEKMISVHKFYVGEYVTSLEMAGLSVSVLKLDDELTRLMEKSAQTPFFTQF